MPLVVADHFQGRRACRFSAFHPRALPIPPLLVTFPPLLHPSHPSSPFSFVTSHCLWPCAFLSPPRGLVPPLLPLRYPPPPLPFPFLAPPSSHPSVPLSPL